MTKKDNKEVLLSNKKYFIIKFICSLFLRGFLLLIPIYYSYGIDAITNGNYKQAIIDYSYHFGGIENLFKNQKSNGFYLENVVNADIKYFTSMYTLLCFTNLFLTLLGIEYSKNNSCYKDVKITTHKFINGSKKRVVSLFNVGLTLFHIAFNSSKYIRIPYRFILYDI